MKIDSFASTARGLFLSPESPYAFQADFAPDPQAVPSNGIFLGEVVDVPENAPIDRLETLEALQGTHDAWKTSEMKLREKMNVVVTIGGRYANRSVSGREPDSPAAPGAVLDLLNIGGVCGVRTNPRYAVRENRGERERRAARRTRHAFSSSRYSRYPVPRG